MKRKELVFLAYIASFSCMAYCMDDPIAKKDLEKNQTIIQITNEPITANKIPKKPPAVPNIVLVSQGSPGSSSRNLMKTRVGSTKELQDHIKKTQNTQRTARDTPPVRRAGPKLNIDGDDQAPIAATITDDFSTITRTKKSFLPQSIDALPGKKLDQRKKMYTEEDLWSFAESLSPILYEFGKKHNLALEDLELFAACISELEINPQLITEHMHASNEPIQKGVMQQLMDRLLGDPHEQHLDNLHKQYAKMQREKPEDYKALLLELMKTVADQAEGQQANRSTIADTHTSLQSQAVADKEQERRLAYFVAAVTLITAVGGWVFGLVGQFNNPTNSTH